MDERDVQRSDDGDDRREPLPFLGVLGGIPDHEVAEENEPQQQCEGQARFPCPIRAPGDLSPEWPRREHDRGEDHASFRGGYRRSVESLVPEPQVHPAQERRDPEAHERGPGRRYVDEDDRNSKQTLLFGTDVADSTKQS